MKTIISIVLYSGYGVIGMLTVSTVWEFVKIYGENLQ
jgi:hypothetical protein